MPIGAVEVLLRMGDVFLFNLRDSGWNAKLCFMLEAMRKRGEGRRQFGMVVGGVVKTYWLFCSYIMEIFFPCVVLNIIAEGS